MRRRRFDQINIVPFIDIVLVLLVIVLATATFAVHSRLSVDLPTARSGTELSSKEHALTIERNGTILFDGRALSLERLRQRLGALNPERDPITLNADRGSRFQSFVDVVDLLKKLGFKKLNIVTRR